MATKKVKSSSNAKAKQPFDKFEGTIGDYLKQANDDLLSEMIRTGKLFKINIYDYTRLMDNNSQMFFFEKVDQLNIGTLVTEYKLDYDLIKKWLDSYINYRLLLKQSNKQLTYQSTTNEQVVLYRYLQYLGLITIDNSIQDASKRAKLLSFLLNRDISNITRSLRYSHIKDREREYYTEGCLQNILQLATEINLEGLAKAVKKDMFRLYKK